MKILLAENAAQYTSAVASSERALEPLQTVLDAYTALGIATVPVLSELAEVQLNPRGFLVKMMTNRQPVSMTVGITLPYEKAYELMEKPAGAEDFVALVGTLFPRQASDYVANQIDVATVDLVNGQVQLKQTVKDMLLEQSRIYATTQAQKDEWDQLQIIAGALNTIRQYPRMGARFDTDLYLRKMLKREGHANEGYAIEVSASEVVRQA